MLVPSLSLQQVIEVGTVTQKEISTEYKILTYTCLALTIFGLVMDVVLHYRKSKLCRGCMFSNTVKIMIFSSDVQYYGPIKLSKTAGSIHLFRKCKIKLELYLGYLRNRLEVSQHDF